MEVFKAKQSANFIDFISTRERHFADSVRDPGAHKEAIWIIGVVGLLTGIVTIPVLIGIYELWLHYKDKQPEVVSDFSKHALKAATTRIEENKQGSKSIKFQHNNQTIEYIESNLIGDQPIVSWFINDVKQGRDYPGITLKELQDKLREDITGTDEQLYRQYGDETLVDKTKILNAINIVLNGPAVKQSVILNDKDLALALDHCLNKIGTEDIDASDLDIFKCVFNLDNKNINLKSFKNPALIKSVEVVRNKSSKQKINLLAYHIELFDAQTRLRSTLKKIGTDDFDEDAFSNFKLIYNIDIPDISLLKKMDKLDEKEIDIVMYIEQTKNADPLVHGTPNLGNVGKKVLNEVNKFYRPEDEIRSIKPKMVVPELLTLEKENELKDLNYGTPGWGSMFCQIGYKTVTIKVDGVESKNTEFSFMHNIVKLSLTAKRDDPNIDVIKGDDPYEARNNVREHNFIYMKPNIDAAEFYKDNKTTLDPLLLAILTANSGTLNFVHDGRDRNDLA